MNKRLIEDSLPLKEISEQSAREKSIRHGHISTLHLWWSRKPLAVCRAVIYASLVPAPKDEKERKEQHEFIIKLVNWDTLNPKHPDHWVIGEAKRRILEANGGVPPKVLDPFAGGGSIPLEAQRLGCETYASDLNPLAHIIELCTLYYPQKYAHIRVKKSDGFGGEIEGDPQLTHDVRKWGKWIYDRAKEEIGHLYDTGSPDETSVAYIWARTVTCPNPACRAEVPLVHQWWLCKNSNKNLAIKPIPNLEEKRVDFEIVEGKDIDFDPSDGTIVRGNAACPCCGQVTSVNDIRQIFRDKKQGNKLLCVIYLDKNTPGKNYRVPCNNDIESFDKAVEIKRQLEKQRIGEFSAIPDEPLPPVGSLGFRVNNYGFLEWGSLFNPRQAVALVTFCKYIKKAYYEIIKEVDDEEYAKALLTFAYCILGRISSFLSSLCSWKDKGEFVAQTFVRQALSMSWDYSEVNPLGGASGDWYSSVDWIIRFLDTLKEIDVSGFVNHISANSIDFQNTFSMLISDPPYYDAIPYSDLSDFFYVWMKRSIGFLYPDVFSTQLTPKRSEIIQNPTQNKSKEFFEEKMQSFFNKAHKAIEKNGIIVLVYAHKSTEAWETLLKGLLQEDIVVTSSWPIHTERTARLRAYESAALASSVFIVCRKRNATEDGFEDDVDKELRESLYERLSYFWSQGIRGADFFMSAIGPAVQVFGKYKKVYKVQGGELTVADLLLKVRGIVSDFALKRIVHIQGEHSIDDESRFYLLWRWAFGNAVMPAGEVIPMAQSLGVEFNDLVANSGVLDKKGDKVTLRGPLARKKEKHLGEPDKAGTAPLIDVLHRCIHLWQEGKRQEISNLIARAVPGGRDKLEQLAQSITDVLPDNDKEATLYVNFLTGARQLPEAASNEGYVQEEMEFI